MTPVPVSHPAGQGEAPGFLWGVATSAYQSEGGYNGPGQPQTNWSAAERAGKVAPLGQAAQFWTRYPDDFARCRHMGLSAFRLGIEWARVQPTLLDRRGNPPEFDAAALDHYADMLAACRMHGLEPVVTLHHFVHPAWLGTDAWLAPETVAHFAAYVETTVRHLNIALVRRRQRPIRYYLTVNEPNMLALHTYVSRQFPGARRGLGAAATALNHLLCAHVRAYRSIHSIHGAEGWPRPAVTFNNYCSDLYWLDKLIWDLMAVRERSIPPEAILNYVHEQSRDFDSALAGACLPLRKDLAYLFGALFKKGCQQLARVAFDPRHFEGFLAELYEGPDGRVMDYLALDYYDPFTAHLFRFPKLRDHEFAGGSFHSWATNSITSKWWDWRVLPKGLHFFCTHYAAEFTGLPVLIAENGMAQQRRIDNTATHRRDRMTRSEFLELHLREVDGMLRESVPLLGYLHWSLFDNYEWGTYTPRFGLFSLDYRHGTDRLKTDHHGDCPSDTYRRLIGERRAFKGNAGG